METNLQNSHIILMLVDTKEIGNLSGAVDDFEIGEVISLSITW